MDTLAICEALTTPILLLDAQGNEFHANTALKRLLELDSEETSSVQICHNLLSRLVDKRGQPVTLNDIRQGGNSDWYLLERSQDFAPIKIRHILMPDGQCLLELQQPEQEKHCQIDHLTGLMNRYQIQALMAEAFATPLAPSASQAVLLVDIDRLKVFNDYHGYRLGDQIIRELGRRFASNLPSHAKPARWSGHEYLVWLDGELGQQADDVAQLLHQQAASVKDSLNTEISIPLSISIGIAHRHPDDINEQALISRANAALFEAKRRGRNRSFNADQLETPSVFVTAGALNAALKEGRIRPALQPIIDLQTGVIVADEALARLIEPDGRVIPAVDFMEAASLLQMAHYIDVAIIRQIIEYCATSSHPERSHFVNISGDLLRQPDQIEYLLELIHSTCKHRIPYPNNYHGHITPLVIEITEREMLPNTIDALNVLQPFLDFGLRLAIDDFGSGYSSFRYLHDLPITFLKIEGELVRHISDSQRARSLVHGIQRIAEDLNLITIAELIEDRDTAEILRELGVNWAQGYYFGQPQLLPT